MLKVTGTVPRTWWPGYVPAVSSERCTRHLSFRVRLTRGTERFVPPHPVRMAGSSLIGASTAASRRRRGRLDERSAVIIQSERAMVERATVTQRRPLQQGTQSAPPRDCHTASRSVDPSRPPKEWCASCSAGAAVPSGSCRNQRVTGRILREESVLVRAATPRRTRAPSGQRQRDEFRGCAGAPVPPTGSAA